MSLNLEAKDCYHVFDEFGMLCIPSDQSWEKRSWWKKLWDKILKREWIPTWSNKSWRDSLGRTILAGLAYGFTDEIIAAIESCYRNGVLYRHPDHDEVASRDHHSYFIIYRKYTNQEIPDFPRMLGLNSWMKALTGNKRAEWWYYFWAIPSARIGNCFLRFLRWVGRIGPERDNKWWITPWDIPINLNNNGLILLNRRTRWQKLWAWIIFTSMPAYALHNKAWQIYVMPDSKKKSQLKRILLKRIAPRNLMLRLLLGDDTVTQEEVDNYPHMTGYPPGVYLDPTCRRNIRELTDEEAKWNTYEWDLIFWLFNKKKS